MITCLFVIFIFFRNEHVNVSFDSVYYGYEMKTNIDKILECDVPSLKDLCEKLLQIGLGQLPLSDLNKADTQRIIDSDIQQLLTISTIFAWWKSNFSTFQFETVDLFKKALVPVTSVIQAMFQVHGFPVHAFNVLAKENSVPIIPPSSENGSTAEVKYERHDFPHLDDVSLKLVSNTRYGRELLVEMKEFEPVNEMVGDIDTILKFIFDKNTLALQDHFCFESKTTEAAKRIKCVEKWNSRNKKHVLPAFFKIRFLSNTKVYEEAKEAMKYP
uniref:Uncharacterized protein n=1 Tax=Panagrolaimus superbus TaxID=310955 RepID=A0A914YD90_9BILA